MRVSASTFFSAGAGTLVTAVAPDPDELIINCYRLADRYHLNPDVFLDMPISRIDMHVRYTVRLMEMKEAAQRKVDDDDA